MKICSSIISLLILVLLSLNLTSCSNLLVSPTSTPTATQKATLETPTQTPLPTATPTEAPLPEGKIAELKKQLEGTEYSFKWDKKDLEKIVIEYADANDPKNKSVIEGLYFDKDANWKRTYVFETSYGTTAEVSIDSRVDKIVVIKGEDGKSILDFSGWSLIDGKWAREYEQGEVHFNVVEAQFMIIDNGSQDPKDGINVPPFDPSVSEQYKQAITPGIAKINGVIRHNDLKEIIDTGSLYEQWRANDIKLLNELGEPLIINTTFFVVLSFLDKTSAIIYRDVDREHQIVFVDTDLRDLTNWSPYFKVANQFK